MHAMANCYLPARAELSLHESLLAISIYIIARLTAIARITPVTEQMRGQTPQKKEIIDITTANARAPDPYDPLLITTVCACPWLICTLTSVVCCKIKHPYS